MDADTSGVGQDNADSAPVRRLVRAPTGSLSETLWIQAIRNLSEEDRARISDNGADRRVLLENLLHIVVKKKNLSEKKKWKFRNSKGDEVYLRDLFGKIIVWVTKFKEVGDTIVQYDPVHAALPWAAVRFLLQVTINDTETYGAMISGVEYVSRLIIRYQSVEGIYLRGNTPLHNQFATAVTRLYSAILVYLSKATKYYGRSTLERSVKSVVQPAASAVDVYLVKISTEEAEVEKLARLLDSDFSYNSFKLINDGLNRLDTELNSRFSTLTSKFEGIQIGATARPDVPLVPKERLLKWLNYVSTEDIYQKALSLRLEGTCSWFIQRKAYKRWIDAHNHTQATRVLWVHGGPGFGKSVLCAHIIDHLQKSITVPIAYFFCIDEDEKRRQTHAILRSWIAQIADKNEEALQIVRETHEGNEAQPSTDTSIWTIFKKIQKKIGGCVFILDGFDEMENMDRSHRIPIPIEHSKFLSQLLESLKGTQSHLLIISRDIASIRTTLFDKPQKATELVSTEYQISMNDTSSDVSKFSSHMIKERLPKKSQQLQDDLAREAAQKCSGMFLWLNLLQSRLNPGQTSSQLQKIVQDAPPRLDQAYAREVRNILTLDEDEKKRALSILRWTIFSARPLLVGELTEALLAEGAESDELPRDDLPEELDMDYVNWQIKRLCGSLITVRKAAKMPISLYTVHLVHFSMKEFLVNDVNIGFSSYVIENHKLGQTCLRYLLLTDFQTSEHLPKEQLGDMIYNYHFLSYVVPNWSRHVLQGPMDEKAMGLLRTLFVSRPARWLLWADLNTLNSQKYYDPLELPNSALYYVSMLGIESLIDELLLSGEDVNSRGGVFGSPLGVACEKGNAKMVEKLLQHGADFSVPVYGQDTALHVAAFLGHSVVALMLIEAGADFEAVGDLGWVPLHAAAAGGSEQIVKALLARGAKANATADDGVLPLHSAAEHGDTSIVELLLDNSNINTKESKMGRTPLHVAAESGHPAVLQLLLSRGGDITATTTRGNTPLHLAAMNGSDSVVKILIDNGADISATEIQGLVPLYLAAQYGNDSILRILLDKGALIEATTNKGQTAMHIAAYSGQESTVRFLIEEGANASAADCEERTAIHLAAERGHLAVTEILVNHGCDLDVATKDGWNSLYISAQNGHDDVVKYLLAHGADIKFRTTGDGSTALHSAVQQQHESTAKILIDAGADVDSPDANGFTPFMSAAKRGYESIAKILLDHGSDISRRQNDEANALHYAAHGGQDNMIKFLLAHGAEVNATSKTWAALNFAAAGGFCSALELLIEHGADVDAQNALERPLTCAAANGHDAAVRLLLEYGASINLSNASGWTALHAACEKGHISIAEILVKGGADLSAVDVGDFTPLHIAAQNGHDALIKIFVSHGCDVDSPAENGWSCLQLAAEKGHASVVQLLIELGADPNTKLDNGFATLITATTFNHEPVVKILADAGADVSVVFRQEWPLLIAATEGYEGITKTLLSSGANPRMARIDGLTALHAAAGGGFDTIVSLLITAGADLEAAGEDKDTPLLTAAIAGKHLAIVVLLDNGADIAAQNDDGDSALHLAALSGHDSVVETLIERRANVNAINKNGNTPLHDAAANSRGSIVKLLIEAGANKTAVNNDGKLPHLDPNDGQGTKMRFRNLIKNKRANLEMSEDGVAHFSYRMMEPAAKSDDPAEE